MRWLLIALILYIVVSGGLRLGAYLLQRWVRGRLETVMRQQRGPISQVPTSDELVEDPVCHIQLPKHLALTKQVHGATFYFCGDECMNKY